MERKQRNECAMMRDGMLSHTEHNEKLIVIVIFHCSPLYIPVTRLEVGRGYHRLFLRLFFPHLSLTTSIFYAQYTHFLIHLV